MKKFLLILCFISLSTNATLGQNWQTSNTALTTIRNVSAVNDDVVWVNDSNLNNGFSISIDGGITWESKNYPSLFIDNNFGLGMLSAVDTNTAYIIVSLADNPALVGLYKTTDAGDTWLREGTIFNSVDAFPNHVHFWDNNNGVAVGDNFEVFVYQNGTWFDQSSQVSSAGFYSANSPDFIRIVGDSIYLLTNAGTILKSADKGVTWTELTTPFSNFDNLSFEFKDDLNGMLVFNDNASNQIYLTADGGITWNLSGSNVANLLSKIEYVPNEDRFYSAGVLTPELGLSYSDDNGATWTIDSQFNTLFVGEIESTSNGTLFAGVGSDVYYQNQIPLNNLIENAILINSFPFTDNDVRLDLATASGINDSSGCPVGNYNAVYYKFTATESAQFEVFIEDTNSDPVGTSFAIIYTAPNLNVTNESELSIATACGFSASSYLDVVQGTNYYVLIHRSQENASSNIIFESTPVLAVPASERDALIALYNATNGDNWERNTNWNSTELVGNWEGIRTTNIGGIGHVSEINLGGNNLTGTLPTEIGSFPELTYLGLWGNLITGNIPPEIGNLINLKTLDITPNTFSGSIPDEIGNLINLEVLWLNQNGLTGTIPSSFQNLTSLRELYLMGSVNVDSEWSDSAYNGDFPDLTALPLEILRLQDNFFQFEDIADEFATYQANIPDFVFNPQYTVDPPEEVESDFGDDITLTLTDIPGTNRHSANRMSGNSYQWFKDANLIIDANASSYTIINAQGNDSGVYSCQITNADVPGFIVTRSDITVDVGGTLSLGEISLNPLVNIYPNPTDSFINISLPDLNTETSLIIYDMLGKRIQQSQLKTEKIKLDVSDFQSGIYLMHFKIGDKTLIKKLIKK